MAYVFIYQHFLLVEATQLNNSAPIITGWVYHDYPRQTMPSLEWARLSTVLTEFAFILSAALTFPCAAWLLHLEDRLGSIETGKWADFTVLAEEVTEANKATMKDIEIIGTVSGGVIQ